jgi:hypothetical protein
MQHQTLFHRATLLDYLPKARVAGCPPPIVRHVFPLAQGYIFNRSFRDLFFFWTPPLYIKLSKQWVEKSKKHDGQNNST